MNNYLQYNIKNKDTQHKKINTLIYFYHKSDK